MLKKFIRYYRPHLSLFVIDMLVASAMSLLLIFFPYITRNLLRSYIPESNVPMIIWSLAALGSICLFMLVLNYIRIKWGHILGVRMEADMRKDIFRHVQKLSFTWFDNTKTGHIMSRISNDLNMIAEVAHHAPEDLLISLVVLIGAYIFMFSFSWPLALISLIPFPFMLIWGIIFGGRMRSGFRKVRKEIAEINSTVENSVQGIREVKAFANEELEEEKFHNSNTTFRYAKENAYTAMAGFHSVIHFLRDSYYLVVVGGGVLLIFHGLIEVYDLLSFVLFVGIILPPIDRLINFNEQLQQGTAAFERFVEIMEIEPDIADRPGSKTLAEHSREIRFRDVHFSYAGSPEPVLKGINLTVPFGSKVALVGESGAGKSTLVSLIPRFYEVSQGEISIDGMDVKNLTQKSLREQTGIVQQNVFLFDTSLRENIMYGNPLATEEEMVRAASWANILDFIQSLPEGFDTEVGERGVKLSGGQKQRIAIARVFLKNPPILILDEATSALDTESEALIQNAMFRLAENRTTIIIAHRLSTVRNVDRIYVMKEGRIIEEGAHSELLALKGYYERLYTQRRL
ncbi:thiamine ABC transporter permease [Marispirochaeta aestuarii]|uniref:Thiamine ABC transporter permease n=1 Tax=Marispirochaeta aestuarii TaxID=1963862 RepID=A0A1Y1RZZ6_9SPIO|nr:ABC transporter ATP-binding protein [Marispirochaeta aestuarii]ORC35727.1 thiamine ABC transporter permease [Marispirochaeta aestuarii]